VLNRLGVRAAPVNFPGRVFAHVPTPSGGPALLVDVFASLAPVLPSADPFAPTLASPEPQSDAGTGRAPPVRLHVVEITAGADVAQPAGAGALLLRATRNILASFQQLPHAPPGAHRDVSDADIAAASYGAVCARWVLTDDPASASHVAGQLAPFFPLDAEAIGERLCAFTGLRLWLTMAGSLQ
jgi:hypothetical protein